MNRLDRIAAWVERQDRAVLTLWVFTASVLLTMVAVLAAARMGGASTGTVEYEQIARNVAAGHGFVFRAGESPVLWRPPLYVYILALFYSLMRDPYPLVVGLQIVLSGATAAIAFRIGERIFSRTVGALAALAVSVYPIFMYNCLRLMPEALFSLVLAVAVLLLIDYLRASRWTTSVALGLLLGVASLLKASAMLLPLFILAGMLLAPRGRTLRTLEHWAVLAFAMALTILPWTLRNYRVSGDLIPIDSSGGYAFWVGNRLETDGQDDDPLPPEQIEEIMNDAARIIGIDHSPGSEFSVIWAKGAYGKALQHAAIRSIIHHPVATAGLWVRKLYRFWFTYIGTRSGIQAAVFWLQLALLLPAIMGLLAAWRDGRAVRPLLLVIAYFVLLHVATAANVRYSAPILPFIMLVAAYGVVCAGRRWRQMRRGTPACG